MLTSNSPMTQREIHLEEWNVQSAIDSSLTNLALETIADPQEIKKLLNWENYHGDGGWYTLSIDPSKGNFRRSGQFKPNKPLERDGKQQKYLTFPKGAKSEVLFPVVTLQIWENIANKYNVEILPADIIQTREDKGFWKWVEGHRELPLMACEGAKKGYCALTHGYIPVVLPGVWNGLEKKKLHKDLLPFFKPGRKIIFAFDADVTTKKEVQQALYHTAAEAKGENCVIFIAEWDIELGKGIDDLVVEHGPEQLKAIMDGATPYTEWLKKLDAQFKESVNESEGKKKDRIPPADKVAKEIAEEYRDRLIYDAQRDIWMHYEVERVGVWGEEKLETIRQIIYKILSSKGIEGFGSDSYVRNIERIMRYELLVRKWEQRSPKELIPFKNGVLEIATGEFLPHAPGYRFIWSIDREYNPLAKDWSLIDYFLTHLANNNPILRDILICFCNAILKGRSDLQKFLHLIGVAGAGKGTFGNLITAMVGEENTCSTTLNRLCNTNFGAYNSYGKRITILWDEDSKVSSISTFLSLTSGDYLSAEKKGEQDFPFRYDGMVVVFANKPWAVGEAARRIYRREVTVPVRNAVKESQWKGDLTEAMIKQLDAFTSYLLTIPDDHVTKTLRGSANIPMVTAEFWQNRTAVDSVASWLNDCCIHDELAPKTLIGANAREYESGTPKTLYGSYVDYCKRTGRSGITTTQNFSKEVLELCKYVLGWTDVNKVHTANGKAISGLRVRVEGTDNHIPTHDLYLEQLIEKELNDDADDLLTTTYDDHSKVDKSKVLDSSDNPDSINSVETEKKKKIIDSLPVTPPPQTQKTEKQQINIREVQDNIQPSASPQTTDIATVDRCSSESSSRSSAEENEPLEEVSDEEMERVLTSVITRENFTGTDEEYKAYALTFPIWAQGWIQETLGFNLGLGLEAL